MGPKWISDLNYSFHHVTHKNIAIFTTPIISLCQQKKIFAYTFVHPKFQSKSKSNSKQTLNAWYYVYDKVFLIESVSNKPRK